MAKPLAEGSSTTIRFGYTLLELMITLAVMAGMVAVVWPSLIKPLTQSELKQAAWTVRDALDDRAAWRAIRATLPSACCEMTRKKSSRATSNRSCYTSKIANRQPLQAPVRFEHPNTIEHNKLDAPNSSSLRRWEIPADVRIEDWRWTSQPAEQSDDEYSSSNFDRSTSPRSPENRRIDRGTARIRIVNKIFRDWTMP